MALSDSDGRFFNGPLALIAPIHRPQRRKVNNAG